MSVLGAVLTGGQSARFGSDKAVALWRGRPLVQHAWDALAAHCDDIVMCGRAYLDRACVPDAAWAGMGPLGGICAALHHARDRGFDRVVTLPCDMPDVPDDLVAALASSATASILAAAPVVGVWPVGLAEQLETFVRTDRRRSLRGWAQAAGADMLSGWSPANVNHPADLAALDD